MAKNKYFSVFVSGKEILLPESDREAFFDRLIAAGAGLEASPTPVSEAAPVEEVAESPAKLDGYKSVGVTTAKLERDGRIYPKGSLVIGKATSQGNLNLLVTSEAGRSKIAKSMVKMTGEVSEAAPEKAKAPKVDKSRDGFNTIFDGTIKLAGQKKVGLRVTTTSYYTYLIFDRDLRSIKKAKWQVVYKRLSAAAAILHRKMTNERDGKSVYVIKTVLPIAKVTELLS